MQLGNQKDVGWFCICCSNCCEILKNAEILDKPASWFATNYHFETDQNKYKACRICEDRCPIGAIIVDKKSCVNLDRCIGCGVCVTGCPEKAISLKYIEIMIEPPESNEEFYGKIFAEKYKDK